MATYFVIRSDTGQYGSTVLRPQIQLATDKGIVAEATWELSRKGKTLEDMAGIPLVEDQNGAMGFERELSYEEDLALSVQKLGDDGRVFRIFPTTEAGAAALIEAAGEYSSLESVARAIVRGTTWPNKG